MVESIYVLELQDGKYYVGKTQKNVQERFEEHRTGKGSAWTKYCHKPMRLVEQYVRTGDYDEDNTTKQYMEMKGIDNVRGGSYSNVHLSSAQKELLTREFRGAADACNQCGEPDHFARECPNANTTTTTNARRGGETNHAGGEDACAAGRCCQGVTLSGNCCRGRLYLNRDGFCPSHQDQLVVVNASDDASDDASHESDHGQSDTEEAAADSRWVAPSRKRPSYSSFAAGGGGRNAIYYKKPAAPSTKRARGSYSSSRGPNFATSNHIAGMSFFGDGGGFGDGADDSDGGDSGDGDYHGGFNNDTGFGAFEEPCWEQEDDGDGCW
eukprot:CAMPEP_0117056920 /NCGR_PEP_ID=MMETSP0472-20121206/39501_1 /TAXON_ID=693140 ORGANISM="Tiarina fusus, Strain LIS" /NCGR_SAMPLE_ID=MMETSP0472 /ASSEMBLY_ACC=CAM_ASM_000603 /LENGTH=324 /DNA_ID=CAMNT_0004773573 /DNA_START=38 /DNA_END=1012 /DNA_ORIENTATION=-